MLFGFPCDFSNFNGLAYSLVFFTHLAFAKAHGKTRSVVLFLLMKLQAMKYKGLVDPKNKPFGNLLPFEVQVIIMFWTQCFMTNDRRKKMNAEFTRLPRCQTFQSSWHFRFQAVTVLSFSSAMENKPYPRFYGCPHCFNFLAARYTACEIMRAVLTHPLFTL